MKSTCLAGSVFAIGLLVSSTAYAVECKSQVKMAESEVASAVEVLNRIADPGFKTRVRVLVDDATMLANSSKRLCGRENATKLTLARAQAQANSAVSWAKAAKELATAYASQ